MNWLRLLVLAAALSFVCSAAQAHPTAPAWEGGFLSGAAHPLAGLDHLLAILAVGLLSAQVGGRAIWALPTAFVGSMLAGCVLGAMGWMMPAVEFGIAVSVLLLGLAVAMNCAGPLAVSLIAAAGFGLCHGHVHGTEMPLLVAPALYAAGFAITTLGLQCVGILVGRWAICSLNGAIGVRLAGALVAACGLVLLVV